MCGNSFPSFFPAKQWSLLNAEWLHLIQNGLSQGTWKNLRTHVGEYRAFALKYNFVMLPIQTTRLCLFATHLAVHNLSESTIRNYFASLSSYSQLLGFAPIDLSNVFLKLTLRGIGRTHIKESKAAKPISRLMLTKMSQFVNLSHPIQVAAWAAILVAFYSLLRKSNLVPNTTADFDPKKQLSRHDVHFRAGFALLNIKWSKTRQAGQRYSMPLIPNHSNICPVSALKRLFLLVRGQPSDPLFAFRRKSKCTQQLRTLTYVTLQYYLKSWLTKAGYKPQRYSCHSLRRGGATFAFSRKVPSESIQKMGDWASDCYKKYLEEDLSIRISAAVDLADDYHV